MTNQEAIEHLKNIKIYSFQDGYTDEAREALDMAIKALEAQELSNNSPKLDSEFGDLISRQAAIDEIKALYEWHDTVTEDRTIDHLKRLPSAQPDLSGYSDRLWRAAYERGKAEAQRTGKWIDDEGNAATDKYCATCSACGEWSEYLTAYCPNCGAKME